MVLPFSDILIKSNKKINKEKILYFLIFIKTQCNNQLKKCVTLQTSCNSLIQGHNYKEINIVKHIQALGNNKMKQYKNRGR